jgi:hypothetical protein
MYTPSNLYAEKIFSEHPIILWALDDTADYISLIPEVARNIEDSWSFINGSASIGTINKKPFVDSYTNLLTGDFPTTFPNDMLAVSPYLFNLNELNQNPGNLSIGTYFYSDSQFLESITIGYLYNDPITSSLVVKSKKIDVSINQKWSFISEVFPVENINADAAILISLNFISGGSSASDYNVYINGISVGQFAENSNAVSLGVEKITLPTNIAIPATDAIEAFSYGSIEDNGYYIVKNNTLLARNTGLPLVYGASNITKIIPNENNLPSLIVPGKGFLNNVGRYQDYTVEFWARVDCENNQPKRIFGPIASTDGLYVENGYMTLQIGNQYKTHFISEWFRPMLIDIRVVKNKAVVLLNSEEVISMDIDVSKLSLPDEFDQNGDSQDWLGFYSYSDVSVLEIDCVAIYPYNVSQTIAKRRMVYAQAVVSGESIESSYSGKSAYIDYPFADYTANYSYPDFAAWQQGTFNNLKTTKEGITTPDYELPQIFLEDKTLQDLYDDSEAMTAYRSTYNNLVENPSFRNNFTDWYALSGTSASILTTGGIDSGKCARVTTTAGGNPWAGLYCYPSTDGGYFSIDMSKGLSISFLMKAVSGPVTPKLVVGLYNSSFGLQSNITIPFGTIYPSDGWVQFNENIFTYSNTKYIGYVTFGPSVSVSGLSFDLDDVMLYQRDGYNFEPWLPYFDGSKNSFGQEYNAVTSWSGTADNSKSIATIDGDYVWRAGYRPISFRPNSTWDNKKCYFHYNKYGFMNEPIDAIYSVFSTPDVTTEQTLFKVYNVNDNSYFRCYIEDGVAYLAFDVDNFSYVEVFSFNIEPNEPTLIGLKIRELTSVSFTDEFGSKKSLKGFFSNPSLLKMYVGGDDKGFTFKGSIYSVSIDTLYNNDGLADSLSSESNPLGAARDAYFNYYGAPLWTNQTPRLVDLLERGSSYSLKPVNINDQFKLDIEVVGEWSDYIPLTYFAQYITDKSGNKVYDLDFVQFNANLPESTDFNLVKTYVTFQYISDGSNKNLKQFAQEVDLGNGRVLDLNDYPSWQNTKFRIFDNTIIYPRNDVPFEDLSISYYIPFRVPASLSKNAQIKKLEFSSQAFSNNSFNPVGTKFGTNIYPYKKTGFYYDYKGKNPFAIYKGTTPYLYLTKKSGIQLYKDFTETGERGLSIPINEELSTKHDIGGMQIWMYCEKENFPVGGYKLFELNHKNGTINFFGIPVNSQKTRIKIYAIDSATGLEYSGLSYYLNGTIVKDPIISIREWASLGVAFLPTIQFDSFLGSINLTSPVLFNNISVYKAGQLQEGQSVIFRQWAEVKQDGATELEWNYWLNNYIWNNVLIIGDSDSFSVDPSAIYKTYIGTNKIIIDDDEGLVVDIDRFSIRSNLIWQTSTQIPV